MPPAAPEFWSLPWTEVAARLHSSGAGLSSTEASARLAAFGSGAIVERRPLTRLRVLLRQVKSPLVWLLIFAAAISAATAAWVDAVIVLIIVTATAALGYAREYRAERATAALASRIQMHATVIRDGVEAVVGRESVVPGDVICLDAGSLVPADALVIEARDCFAGEAALTGESFPVQKQPGVVDRTASLAERTNCVFLGTSVRSGEARALVVATGPSTEYARIAAHLLERAPEAGFDRGLRRFGNFLTSTMLLLTFLVFIVQVIYGRPPIEMLLFSVALAVGLSPELLPAILGVNLARGAQVMAERGVLVRRLPAIENLGSMDVLCTDKTGTITEGTIVLDGACDADGAPSPAVLEAGAVNARLQAGLSNPLDDAILQAHTPDLTSIRKLGEVPFDFLRKRLSVIVQRPDGAMLITKGAFDGVSGLCTRLAGGAPIDDASRRRLEELHRAWSEEGTRVIAVAAASIATKPSYTRDDEADLTLLGFLTFRDRPKEGVMQALEDLERLGVAVKLITGDNRLVARHVARVVGMRANRLLTGADLSRLDSLALARAATRTDLFVEVTPNQKEQIVVALKKAGHIVGFLGDGVNDAPAMHAADTSVSVERAADVAREAADFVLLERDLDVLRGGIEEGRRTFANTLKYILTTMSANLGNMLSMAAASLVLPFLPLTAGQILLNNLLSDVPAVGIADDAVDPELVLRPPRWDMRFIGRFMGGFGVLSSVFDLLTFGVLIWLFHASVEMFRTGWFVESLLTELVIALVVRTRRPFFRSRPGRLLLGSTLAMIVVAIALPYLPFADRIGFVRPPLSLVGLLAGITALYVCAVEVAKRWFYRSRRIPSPPSPPTFPARHPAAG